MARVATSRRGVAMLLVAVAVGLAWSRRRALTRLLGEARRPARIAGNHGIPPNNVGGRDDGAGAGRNADRPGGATVPVVAVTGGGGGGPTGASTTGPSPPARHQAVTIGAGAAVTVTTNGTVFDTNLRLLPDAANNLGVISAGARDLYLITRVATDAGEARAKKDLRSVAGLWAGGSTRPCVRPHHIICSRLRCVVLLRVTRGAQRGFDHPTPHWASCSCSYIHPSNVFLDHPPFEPLALALPPNAEPACPLMKG